MLRTGDDRMSRVTTCLKAAPSFLISEREAVAIVDGQVRTIIEHWPIVCDEGGLDQVDRGRMWRRQILNPYVLEGAPIDSLGA